MAQDTIVLRDANELQAKVTSVGVNEIVYLKWENLEGPSYTIPKKDVFFIKYANGSKDSFVDQQNISSSTKKAPNSISSGAKFQGYVYLGADFNDWWEDLRLILVLELVPRSVFILEEALAGII